MKIIYKIGFISFVLVLTSIMMWNKPDTIIHSTGDMLLFGDRFMDAGMWGLSILLCIRILAYGEKKDEKE